MPPKMCSSSPTTGCGTPGRSCRGGGGDVSASCTAPRLCRRRASRCGGSAATQKSARSRRIGPCSSSRRPRHRGRSAKERTSSGIQPPGAHLRRQGVRDLVHPADRLEHHHRLVVAELEGEVEADLAAQDLVQRRRRPGDDALLAPAPGFTRYPGGASLVPQASAPAGDVPEVLEEVQQAFLVGRAQRAVQRALVGGLGQQFGDVAVDVGLGCPVADSGARQRTLLVVDVRAGVLVRERFDRHPQLPAVVHRHHPLGDPGRACVEVLALAEPAV